MFASTGISNQKAHVLKAVAGAAPAWADARTAMARRSDHQPTGGKTEHV
jgi:hypothetical protein